MSVLRKGQRCILVKGCPKNVGLLVMVVDHLGEFEDYQDCYEIVTVSGRAFPELWADATRTKTVPSMSSTALTDRHKLRPITDLNLDIDMIQAEMGSMSTIDL
jgi:hypothetical protein